MLDIIILFFLARSIGDKAAVKGLPRRWWVFYTVMAWVVAEMIGILLGLMLLGRNNILSFNGYLIILVCAFGGYLFIRYVVEKMPSKTDDIDKIGEDL
ncbi:MAG: hypothetical protein ABIT96_00230 [Ferruginibacter sp.]